MEGKLTKTGTDQNGNPTYAVIFYSLTLPVDAREVGIRDVQPGDEVTFMTDRETGNALFGEPAPVRGCERARSIERR